MRKNRRKAWNVPKRGRSRYRKQVLHKQKIKLTTAKSMGYSSWDSYAQSWWSARLGYWKHWDFSGRKAEAKRVTNRVLRNDFKADLCAIQDFEELPKAMKGAEYQKLFEYKWYVY